MPYTPDPIAVLAARLDADEARLDKLEVAVSPPAPAPAQPVEDETTKFLRRWAPVTDAEFQARYGVPLGGSIKAMVVFDEEEVIFRARAGYSPQAGLPTSRFSDMAPVRAAIDILAHCTEETFRTFYETGYGTCPPDTAAYVLSVNLVQTHDEYKRSLRSDVTRTPKAFAGQGLQEASAGSFIGGTPSH
jgi:hypothetical protein